MKIFCGCFYVSFFPDHAISTMTNLPLVIMREILPLLDSVILSAFSPLPPVLQHLVL